MLDFIVMQMRKANREKGYSSKQAVLNCPDHIFYLHLINSGHTDSSMSDKQRFPLEDKQVVNVHHVMRKSHDVTRVVH